MKPTKQEHARRIEICRNLLAQRATKGVIKRYLKAEFGTSARTAERYLARAKQLLLLETQKPKEEHVADAYAFYNAVVADTSNKVETRIVAQSRIDFLLGLQSPVKIANTDKDGNDLPAESRRAELAAIIDELRRRAASESADRSSNVDAPGSGGTESA
jgi:hypothetical protein